ncbi:MAG TPA: hypothetical protein VGM11_13345 [Acidobacteriaceae bacterium]|jgi:hypothetical protein
MGAFYANYMVKGADQNSIARALSGRKALVSPEQNGYIFVFDQESDNQDQHAIGKLAERLSTSLRCTVLTVLNQDSDILWYQLYEDGTLTDRYNSTPDYWSRKAEPAPPEGGDAKRLCAAFNCSDVPKVERILRLSWKDYPDATDRHADLFRALDLPSLAVGYGFGAIAQGYFPEGLSAEDLRSAN